MVRKMILILILMTGIAPCQIVPPNTGDCDGNGIVTMSDCVWLINYIFGGGDQPRPCKCVEPSFFLFDDQIDQVFTTLYVDTNWISYDAGGRTFYRGGPVIRVYSIGPDSQPTWWNMIPDSVTWNQSIYMLKEVGR